VARAEKLGHRMTIAFTGQSAQGDVNRQKNRMMIGF
jgi:hypothetical protein